LGGRGKNYGIGEKKGILNCRVKERGTLFQKKKRKKKERKTGTGISADVSIPILLFCGRPNVEGGGGRKEEKEGGREGKNRPFFTELFHRRTQWIGVAGHRPGPGETGDRRKGLKRGGRRQTATLLLSTPEPCAGGDTEGRKGGEGRRKGRPSPLPFLPRRKRLRGEPYESSHLLSTGCPPPVVRRGRKKERGVWGREKGKGEERKRYLLDDAAGGGGKPFLSCSLAGFSQKKVDSGKEKKRKKGEKPAL